MGRETITQIDIDMIPNEEVRMNALNYQEKICEFLNKIRKYVKLYIESESGSEFYHLDPDNPIFTLDKAFIYSTETSGGIHPPRYDIIWVFDLTGSVVEIDSPTRLRDGSIERVLYFSFSQNLINGNRETLRSLGNLNVGICGNNFTSAEGNSSKVIQNIQSVYDLDTLFRPETAAKTVLEINKIYEEYRILMKMQK